MLLALKLILKCALKFFVSQLPGCCMTNLVFNYAVTTIELTYNKHHLSFRINVCSSISGPYTIVLP